MQVGVAKFKREGDPKNVRVGKMIDALVIFFSWLYNGFE